jgi:predicted MFS family arabinose efflux permease
VDRLLVWGSLPKLDWRMTAALAVTGFLLVGVCAVAVGLLHEPLIREFHWNDAAASGLATVYSLAAMLSGPIAGLIIDRIGSKSVMTFGIGLVALGFLAMSLCRTLPGFDAAFLMIGVGYGGAFYLASTKIIATRMGPNKNVGMGIWMFAGSIGAAVFSVTIDWSIRGHGWRSTSLATAALMFTAVAVTLLFIPPEPSSPTPTLEAIGKARRLPPTKLLLAPEFLVTTVAGAFAAFGMSAIYFHTVPIFVKAGFTSNAASGILGASWVLSALGSLATGALSDRMGTRRVLAGSLLCGSVGTFALLLAPQAHFGAMAVITFIVLWGATANAINQFLPLLLVEYYGPVHLGALVGVQGALMGIVGSAAPLITGLLYDRFSSYSVSIIAGGGTTLIALILVMLLKARSEPLRVDATVAAGSGSVPL